MAEMSGKVIRYNLETEIKHGIQVSNLAYAVGMAVSYTHLTLPTKA